MTISSSVNLEGSLEGEPSRFTIYHNQKLFIALKITSALGFFYPIWYLYEQQYLSLSQIALIEAMIVGVQLLLEIPTGAIADLFGYKASVFIGYLTQVVSFLFFIYARTFIGFVLYASLLGIGEALKSGAEEALEYDSLKAIGKENEFPKYKSWYSLAFQLALATAFIVGGIIGQSNMTATIWMTAGSVLASGMIVFLITEPPLARLTPSLKRYIMQLSLGWHELTKDSQVRAISYIYLAVGIISWTTNLSLLNMHLVQIGFSPSELGWVMGILRVINIVVLMRILKRLVLKDLDWKIYGFFIFLFLVGYVPAAFISKWPSVALIGLIMISTTARWIILGSFLHRRIDSKNRATALSTASMGISLGQMAIMASAASILPALGGPKNLVSLLGIIGAITCLFLFVSTLKVHSRGNLQGSQYV